jgi:hypothetical protein
MVVAFAWLQPAAAANTLTDNYADIYAYCAAAGTVDGLGKHYVGANPPANFPAAHPLALRCYSGLVFFCFRVSTNSCEKGDYADGYHDRGFLKSEWLYIYRHNDGWAYTPAYDSNGALSGDAAAAARPNDTQAAPPPQAPARPRNGNIGDVLARTLGVAPAPVEPITPAPENADKPLPSGTPSPTPIGQFSYQCWDNAVKITATIAEKDVDQFADQPAAYRIFAALLPQGNALCDAVQSKQYGVPVSVVRDMQFDLNGGCLSGYLMVKRQDVEFSRNCAVERRKQRAADIAARQFNDEVQQSQNKLNATGATARIELADLVINPFLYQGQVIAVPLIFDHMVAANEALFYNSARSQVFDVVDLPSTLFRDHIYVVMVVEGQGLRDVPGVGSLPTGRFVTALGCREEKCLLLNDPMP